VRLTLFAMATLAVGSVWPAPQSPVFHAETRLVVLHATVQNGRGEFVTTLNQDAFSVFEDGRRQPITLFRRDDIPVSLGLLIDNSGSMRPIRKTVEAAALAFARASNPLDEMFVLNFADKTRIDVPMTSDIQVLEAGIARADAIGGTAFRDAIDQAESYLRIHGTRDRKILLVITDGYDNASVATVDRIEREAERSETVIYAIGIFGDPNGSSAKAGHRQLDRVTSRTGGLAYYPKTIDQVSATALDLAHQIRNQYTIAYAPLNQALNGSYRSIRLTVTGSDKLVAHTRPGYRATPPE
jgi:Ca-activated chloride channel homolog